MRQRTIKNLDIRIKENGTYYIEDPTKFKGLWNSEVFKNDNPILIEIGSGKGQFIMSMAENNPNINYIAFEGQDDVGFRILEKNMERGLSNLRVCLTFVQDLNLFFNKGEITGVYLSFSDPWPKKKHAKRRLTYHKRIENYFSVMDKGFVEFRTDNCELFNFSLEELNDLGISPKEVSFDFISDISTEYEDKFRALGKKIMFYRIEK